MRIRGRVLVDVRGAETESDWVAAASEVIAAPPGADVEIVVGKVPPSPALTSRIADFASHTMPTFAGSAAVVQAWIDALRNAESGPRIW